jgi:hypothetical protein
MSILWKHGNNFFYCTYAQTSEFIIFFRKQTLPFFASIFWFSVRFLRLHGPCFARGHSLIQHKIAALALCESMRSFLWFSGSLPRLRFARVPFMIWCEFSLSHGLLFARFALCAVRTLIWLIDSLSNASLALASSTLQFGFPFMIRSEIYTIALTALRAPLLFFPS